MKQRGIYSPRRQRSVENISRERNVEHQAGTVQEPNVVVRRTSERVERSTPEERFGRENIFPIVPASKSARYVSRAPVQRRQAETAVARAAPSEAPRPAPVIPPVRATDEAAERGRQRGETLEEARRRIERESAPKPPASAAAEAKRAAGTPTVPRPERRQPAGRRVENRTQVITRTIREKRPNRVQGLETLIQHIRPEGYSLYGRAGTLVIYPEQGPFGRKYYRVKFQGRTFTPTFDTPQQAATFANSLKARAEPEYAARRERMLEADARFFTETTLAHRQHPLFVKVVDQGARRPPPSRLMA